jgi:hypothetical protein
MDRTVDLVSLVKNEVASYDTTAYKAKSAFVADEAQQTYLVVDIPDKDHPAAHDPLVIIMAHVAGNRVIIDVDLTDRPLYEALMQAGIPREQIVLAYAGENLDPEAAS